MLSKLDLIVIGITAFVVYNVCFANEKMAFLEIKNSSTFETYTAHRRNLLAKYHPDSNDNGSQVDDYEKVQELDKLLNTSSKFRQKIMELFIFGDFDENTLNKFRNVGRKITQVILIISFECIVIFAKVSHFKQQLLSFLILTILLLPIGYVFYSQYLFVFEGKAIFFTTLRSYLSAFHFRAYFIQTTVNELINLWLLVVMAFVNLLVFVLSLKKETPYDFNKLFSELLNETKAVKNQSTESKQALMRSAIAKIDSSMPKESATWRIVQKVFNLISIGLLIYSLVTNK